MSLHARSATGFEKGCKQHVGDPHGAPLSALSLSNSIMYYTQFPILGGLPMPEARRLRGQSDPGGSVESVRQLQTSDARRLQAEDIAA